GAALPGAPSGSGPEPRLLAPPELALQRLRDPRVRPVAPARRLARRRSTPATWPQRTSAVWRGALQRLQGFAAAARSPAAPGPRGGDGARSPHALARRADLRGPGEAGVGIRASRCYPLVR